MTNQLGLALALGTTTANGRIVDACEGCHKQFKPELPSEGVVHPH
jgi:hypothetical protein